MGNYEPIKRPFTPASRPATPADTAPKRADAPAPIAQTAAVAPPDAARLEPIPILPPATAPAEAEPEGPVSRNAHTSPQRRTAHAPVQTMKAAGGAWPPVGPFGSAPVQRKNVTGLPDALKHGVEALSGLPLDDVRVRFNAPEPVAVGALAYTQGKKIYVGAGEERHLPHEAWHVVQQRQGRVRATMQVNGVAVNDDHALEQEADAMGEKAARPATDAAFEEGSRSLTAALPAVQPGIVQRASINPGTFFGATRADNDVDADINANEMSGFGATVNGVTWHTKLTFDPLVTPGVMGGHAMNPEGSGVTGVIGPDHPYGSQPSSLTAAANNATASTIRADGRGHVAAHILNDQLGGPGITQNLFAFPGNANTLMETQVESKMKTAVAAGNFIHYRGVVHHPAQGPADYITMSWNKLDDAGNDIGGGQANAVIRADNTSGGTAAVALGGGTVARKLSLLNPSSPTVIKGTPWGPFQMPDPKQIIALGVFLDYSAFPAVGNKKAFEDFLTANKTNKLGLQLMFLALNNTAMTRTIGRWIGDKSKSQITIKKGRGITQALLDDLKTGTSAAKESAFIEIMDTGDAAKVIPFAAGEFAKAARANARSRV
jgi:uncharacterized protein DUF4157